MAERVAPTVGGELCSRGDEHLIRVPAGRFVVECEPGTVGGILSLDCSLFDQEFGALLRTIEGDGDPTPLAWFQVSNPQAGVSDTALRSLLVSAVAKASAIQFDTLLNDFSSDPSGKRSQHQFCHLAALATRGEFLRLMEYRKALSGEVWNPLVPLITLEHLERAIDQALARA
jgi:hypothetical protein